MTNAAADDAGFSLWSITWEQEIRLGVAPVTSYGTLKEVRIGVSPNLPKGTQL